MATRRRSTLSAESLFQKLKPLAEAGGKSWLRYDSNPDMAKCPIVKKEIIKYKHVLAAVDEKNIKKTTVTAGIQKLADCFSEKWGFTDIQKKAWTSTMINRLRNLLSCYERAVRNGSLWAEELQDMPEDLDNAEVDEDLDVGEEDAESETTVSESEESQEEAAGSKASGSKQLSGAGDWTFGWDGALRLGWRKKDDLDKELSLPPDDPSPTADGNALMKVKFLDGTYGRIPLSVKAWRDLMGRGKSAASKSTALYEEEHKESHHKVSLRQRVDQKLRLIMFDQAKQICQIRVDLFGELPVSTAEDGKAETLPADHPVMLKAVAFMKALVDRYCSGELKDDKDVKTARDSYMKEQGIAAQPKAKAKAKASVPKIEELANVKAEEASAKAKAKKTSSEKKEKAANTVKEPASTPEANTEEEPLSKRKAAEAKRAAFDLDLANKRVKRSKDWPDFEG